VGEFPIDRRGEPAGALVDVGEPAGLAGQNSVARESVGVIDNPSPFTFIL